MRWPFANLLLLAAACTTAPERTGQTGTPFVAADEATRLLVGRFDSVAQAAADPSYRALQLTVCRVSMPDLGERVFYVEQAQMDELEKPNRQQLYLVEPRVPVATLAVARVFELKSPEHAVGLCARAQPPSLTAAAVEEKAGCSLPLTWDGKRFNGGTVGTGCHSSLRGAAYAAAAVMLDSTELRWWDRGYNAQGIQVWGAEKGPYVFLRRTPVR
jgi:CpeT protein